MARAMACDAVTSGSDGVSPPPVGWPSGGSLVGGWLVCPAGNQNGRGSGAAGRATALPGGAARKVVRATQTASNSPSVRRINWLPLSVGLVLSHQKREANVAKVRFQPYPRSAQLLRRARRR